MAVYLKKTCLHKVARSCMGTDTCPVPEVKELMTGKSATEAPMNGSPKIAKFLVG